MDSPKRVKPDGLIKKLQLKNLSATVSLFGATVLSFSVTEEENLLFVSKKAIFDNVKAIRGGIPLVFPQFGAGELPQHGFARTSLWKVEKEEDSRLLLRLGWQDEGLSNKSWKHPFCLEYTIELSEDLGGSLKTSLRIMNVGLVGEDPFTFQTLQHTYLSVEDISQVSILGLGEESKFIDQLKGGLTEKSSSESLQVTQEVDRIYFGNPEAKLGEEVIVETGRKRISVKRSFVLASKSIACDVVVWNPWIEKSKKMADFDDEEYHHMLCIEPGNVARKTDILRGGEDAVLTQVISLL